MFFSPDSVSLLFLFQLASNTELNCENCHKYAYLIQLVFLLLFELIRDEMQTRWVGLHLHSGENSALFLPFKKGLFLCRVISLLTIDPVLDTCLPLVHKYKSVDKYVLFDFDLVNSELQDFLFC